MTMSSMLSKTWSYLHQVTLDPAPGWSVPTKEQRHHLPSGLSSWLHQVTSCLDKEEEKALVTRQLDLIVSKLSQKSISPGVSSDCLVRLVYIHLLGYDTSASFIHCVKMAGAGSLLSRKMGYLACGVIIPASHDLLVLVTNTIIRDISSTNLVDIQLGLTAAANLVTKHLIQLVPVLVDKIVPLVRHSCHLVRKKSVILLDYLCDLDTCQWPRVVSGTIITCLTDSNPGVVISAVQTLSKHMTISDDVTNIKMVVTAALELHNTMTDDNMLPADYRYRDHLVPHLQVYCTRLYRHVSDVIIQDTCLSDGVVSVLQSSLNIYTGCKDLIIQALVYETIITVATISTASCLIPASLRAVGIFLNSKHHSTVYSGLCALDTIFKHHTISLTSDQQSAVLKCLGHSDPGIQRRAAELVVVVANKDSVVNIVDRVLAHLSSFNTNTKTDYSMVVDRLVILVEKFGDNVNDCDWKASTLLRIVQVSKQSQRDRMIERLKFLLSSCDEGDAATILELNRVRMKLRTLLADIIKTRQEAGRPVPPPVTSLQVWCDAQFYNPGEEDSQEIVKSIVATAGSNSEHVLVRLHCIGAIQSLVMKHGLDAVGDEGIEFINDCSHSDNDKVREAAESCQSVIGHSSKTSPASRESSPDLTLSFLDNYIAAGLKSGEFKPYQPKTPNQTIKKEDPKTQLITSPYNVLTQSNESQSWSPNTDGVRTPQSRLWTSAGRVETPEVVQMVEEEIVEMNIDTMNTVSDVSGQYANFEKKSSVLTGDWD